MSTSVIVEVMGRPYTVDFVESGFPSAPMGRCDTTLAMIQIRRDLDPFGQRQTILHELVHAISEDCGLKLDEQQVAVLSNGLASIKQILLEIRP